MIIFDSKFGNNEKLAQALRKGMIKSGLAVDIHKVGYFEPKILLGYNLICVGGPTHITKISKPMDDFLSELESVNLRGKKGFCFGTRMNSRMNIFDINGSAKKIEKKLKKRGVVMVKDALNIIVEGREGPLTSGSEKRFIDLGIDLGGLMIQ